VYIRPTRKISNTGSFFAFFICQMFTLAKQERKLLISGCLSVSVLKIINLNRQYIAVGPFHECHYS
jgi:hypothetical protein